MPAKFLDENVKSKSPGARAKISQSKDKKEKFKPQSPEKNDMVSSAVKNSNKHGRIAEIFEQNLAQFNSMLTVAILRSKNWTREVFYCETYSCLLEQFIELVPKINARKNIILSSAAFVKNLFDLTYRLLKYNSEVHFSETQNYIFESSPEVLPLTKKPKS